MTRLDIQNHMIEALYNAPKQVNPCVHVYISNLFPALFYKDLMLSMPNIAAYKPLGPRDSRDDGTSTRDFVKLDDTLETPMVWREVYTQLTCKTFRQHLLVKFALEIAERYGLTPSAVPDMMVDGVDVRLMRDTVDYKLNPHTDSASKIATMQIYLPVTSANADYGTSFYEQVDFIVGPRQFKEARRMQFLPNSAYTFPIVREGSPKPSWHGRERLDRPSVVRDSLIYNLYKLHNT